MMKQPFKIKKKSKSSSQQIHLRYQIQKYHLQPIYLQPYNKKEMNLVLTKNSTTLHSKFIYIFRSTKVKCPFCDAVSNSIVEYRPSLIGYLITVLSMLLFGLIGFIMLPVLVNLTKSAIHRCAKCLNEVKTNSIFGFSSMDDKVVAF